MENQMKDEQSNFIQSLAPNVGIQKASGNMLGVQ